MTVLELALYLARVAIALGVAFLALVGVAVLWGLADAWLGSRGGKR